MLASQKQMVPPPTRQQIHPEGLPRLKNCSWYSLERSSGSWYNRGITTKCSTSSRLRHLRQEMGWCKEISISRFLRSNFSFTVFFWWSLIVDHSFGSPQNLQTKMDWGYDSFTTSWNRLPLLAARARHEQLSALPLLQNIEVFLESLADVPLAGVARVTKTPQQRPLSQLHDRFNVWIDTALSNLQWKSILYNIYIYNALVLFWLRLGTPSQQICLFFSTWWYSQRLVKVKWLCPVGGRIVKPRSGRW